MNIKKRMSADTPKFWKKIRTVGVVLASVSATIITGGAALPAALVTIAGYVGTAGLVMTAAAQAAVKVEPDAESKDFTIKEK